MSYFDMLKCRETCTYSYWQTTPTHLYNHKILKQPGRLLQYHDDGTYFNTFPHTHTYHMHITHSHTYPHTKHTEHTYPHTYAQTNTHTHTHSYQQTRTFMHTHTYDNDSLTYICWGSNPMRGSCQLLTKGYWFTPRNMVEQWSKSSIHPTSFIYKKQSPNANVCMYMYMYVCKTDRTEMIRDNLNPDFVKKVILNCYFEESQRLKIEV